MSAMRVIGVNMDRGMRNDINYNFGLSGAGLDDVNNRIDNIINNNPQPSEVVDARGTFPVLRDRLNDFDSKITQNDKKTKGIVNIAEYGTLNGDGLTSDQTIIASAVADAKLKGYALRWGDDNKTYLTTASIPDFHSVKHIGNAVIKRGTDLFYLSPTGTQRNKIYTKATGGSNTFDGLSSSEPIAQLGVAFTSISNYGPVLDGYWEIVMTAGTYPNRAVVPSGLLSVNPIEVKGVDVGVMGVPITIISEGLGASAVGLYLKNGTRITISHVKFTGFNGTTSSSGITSAYGSELNTINIHCENCYWGITSQSLSRLDVKQGKYTTCGYLNAGGGTGAGIRSLQLNNHAIGTQNAGNYTDSPIFDGCYQALLLQENSTGHVDWCTIQNCNSGIVLRVNARANVDGTKFSSNGVALRVEANSHSYISSNTVFSTGALENGTNIMRSSGGNVTFTGAIEGVELQYGSVEQSVIQKSPKQTIQTTTNTAFHTLILKTPHWRSTPNGTVPFKKLTFKIFGSLNGTNGNKRINIRLGTTIAGVVYASTDTGSFEANGIISFNNISEYYMFLSSVRHLSTVKQSKNFGTDATTSDLTLTLEGQVDNALDSVIIDYYEIGFAG